VAELFLGRPLNLKEAGKFDPTPLCRTKVPKRLRQRRLHAQPWPLLASKREQPACRRYTFAESRYIAEDGDARHECLVCERQQLCCMRGPWRERQHVVRPAAHDDQVESCEFFEQRFSIEDVFGKEHQVTYLLDLPHGEYDVQLQT
jgi:hypothetical protein